MEKSTFASISTLHKVNSLVIDVLGLTAEHVEHLPSAERGLSVETIALRGYASSTKQTRQKQVDTTVSHPATIWESSLLQMGFLKMLGVEFLVSIGTKTQNVLFLNQKMGILIPCRNP
ncbi:MAG: hypothetical protein ACLRX9_00715 [Streptococcus salivarius]